MTKIIDLTTRSMGASNPFQTRNQSQITRIGIHHSATASGDQFVFENHWRTLGWRNGGYSEIILRNGDVQLCYIPTVVTNGVANHNTNTYHICCVGNGSFTQEQERSLEERIRFNQNRFNVAVNNVLGHNEFSGASTACPGRNMSTLRNRLQSNSNTNNSGQRTHIVKGGETLTSIARHYNTTVDVLMRANNITNPNLIRTGQVLTIPNGATSTTQFYPATNAGSGIVDALKAINVDSSMANRTRIAQANGINGYSGSAAQNTQLLNLLRQGKLKRP